MKCAKCKKPTSPGYTMVGENIGVGLSIKVEVYKSGYSSTHQFNLCNECQDIIINLINTIIEGDN